MGAGAPIPQHAGHQAVAVRHERLFAAGALLERDDNLSKVLRNSCGGRAKFLNHHLQEVQAAVDELCFVQRAIGCLYHMNYTG